MKIVGMFLMGVYAMNIGAMDPYERMYGPLEDGDYLTVQEHQDFSCWAEGSYRAAVITLKECSKHEREPDIMDCLGGSALRRKKHINLFFHEEDNHWYMQLHHHDYVWEAGPEYWKYDAMTKELHELDETVFSEAKQAWKDKFLPASFIKTQRIENFCWGIIEKTFAKAGVTHKRNCIDYKSIFTWHQNRLIGALYQEDKGESVGFKLIVLKLHKPFVARGALHKVYDVNFSFC